MIRRIAMVGLVAVLAPLALAAPAQAKGPVSAVISGPGIDTTRLTFDSDETKLAALLDIAYPWIDGRGVWRAGRPAGELGPMYSVTYRMPPEMRLTRDEVVRQTIYPFADGGAVVYTARGQTMFGNPLQHGWKTASGQLTAVMRDLGAVDPNAATNAASVTPAAATSTREVDDSGAAWPWFAVVAVGIGVLVGVGALWRTRQRPNRG
jgi:hypothetical protein